MRRTPVPFAFTTKIACSPRGVARKLARTKPIRSPSGDQNGLARPPTRSGQPQLWTSRSVARAVDVHDRDRSDV